jgi:hypothetical protein
MQESAVPQCFLLPHLPFLPFLKKFARDFFPRFFTLLVSYLCFLLTP